MVANPLLTELWQPAIIKKKKKRVERLVNLVFKKQRPARSLVTYWASIKGTSGNLVPILPLINYLLKWVVQKPTKKRLRIAVAMRNQQAFPSFWAEKIGRMRIFPVFPYLSSPLCSSEPNNYGRFWSWSSSERRGRNLEKRHCRKSILKKGRGFIGLQKSGDELHLFC